MLDNYELSYSEEESCEMGMLRWMRGHTRKDKLEMKIFRARWGGPLLWKRYGKQGLR